MNIFVLSEDPVKAAQYHCDKHVVKMILETAQLLSTAVRFTGLDYGYKSTHVNHPCSKWLRESSANFDWLKRLGIALLDEYTFRYKKTHKSAPIIVNAPIVGPSTYMTPFALAMPDYCKDKDAVTAYRKYYRVAKSDIAHWTNRNKPEWW